MNNRTHDSHYPWTKKWGAGHPIPIEDADPAVPFNRLFGKVPAEVGGKARVTPGHFPKQPSSFSVPSQNISVPVTVSSRLCAVLPSIDRMRFSPFLRTGEGTKQSKALK